MLKYLLFIAFFAVMLTGYFIINVPGDVPYTQVLTRVYQGLALTFAGALGSLICLHRITR